MLRTFHSARTLAASVDKPRIALFLSEGFHNTPHREGMPYALRGEQIVRIALPANAKSIVYSGDADHDGLDDLFVDAPFAGPHCRVGCDSHTSINGPWLLLHADATGGYSQDDETALKWAKLQCPKLPDDKVDGFDPDLAREFWFWIRCKRLWGATTKSIDAVLNRYCAHRPKDPGPVPCKELLPDWKAWPRAKPPFVLR